MDAVRLALLEIEETVMGNSEIYESTVLFRFSKPELWRLWIDRCLRSKGVMLDSNVEFIQKLIQRWIRDGWGIRISCLPYPTATSRVREAWEALLQLRPLDEECMLIWIRLLNINDPVYTVRVNHEEKQKILEDWIPVAASKLKSSNPLFRTKLAPIYAWIRAWLHKYIPEPLFKGFMLPRRMQYSITAAGYTIVHGTGGYCFVGLELPDGETAVESWVGQEEVD